MEIHFKDEKLRQLFEGEKIKDKKFKYQKPLINQYIKTINLLISADQIEFLHHIKSLRYERLKGNLKGKNAVSINMQYRLIFEEVASVDNPLHIVLLNIKEISKHYE